MTTLSEPDFRQNVQVTFNRIEKAFESIDPDVAECEQSLGSLTITFADETRCILSVQPSVRQLWLAMAAKGTAIHFNYDSGRWVDDKSKGIELVAYLNGYFQDSYKLALKL